MWDGPPAAGLQISRCNAGQAWSRRDQCSSPQRSWQRSPSAAQRFVPTNLRGPRSRSPPDTARVSVRGVSLPSLDVTVSQRLVAGDPGVYGSSRVSSMVSPRTCALPEPGAQSRAGPPGAGTAPATQAGATGSGCKAGGAMRKADQRRAPPTPASGDVVRCHGGASRCGPAGRAGARRPRFAIAQGRAPGRARAPRGAELKRRGAGRGGAGRAGPGTRRPPEGRGGAEPRRARPPGEGRAGRRARAGRPPRAWGGVDRGAAVRPAMQPPRPGEGTGVRRRRGPRGRREAAAPGHGGLGPGLVSDPGPAAGVGAGWERPRVARRGGEGGAGAGAPARARGRWARGLGGPRRRSAAAAGLCNA